MEILWKSIGHSVKVLNKNTYLFKKGIENMNFRIGSIIFVILAFFFVKISVEAKFQVAEAGDNNKSNLIKPTATELRQALVKKD